LDQDKGNSVIQSAEEDRAHEGNVIVGADAAIHPGAMVVEAIDAVITSEARAVLGSERSSDLAG